MARAVLFILMLWSAFPLAAQKVSEAVRLDTMTMVDTARGRMIPVAFYSKEGAPIDHQRPILLSHGYNQNLSGTYLHYSFLAEFLARHGYFVVSIQHELPGDSPLAMTGNLRELRRPNWERGSRSILFVLNELKRMHPELRFAHTSLIGHSNGGDMSVLFAQQHPDLLEKIITLDNRRMPLPRTDTPGVLSLRSNDAPADEGVLPTAEEQAAQHIRIIPLADVKHNEMSDRGNAAQRAEIAKLVLDFLNGR